MSTHDRADEILRGILGEATAAKRKRLSTEDHATIAKMVASIVRGAQGIFVVLDGATVNYLITNGNYLDAADLASKFASHVIRAERKRQQDGR